MSRILITGATGYIGGRLLGLLEDQGHDLRCLARRPEHLEGRVGPATEVVRADVLEPESLEAALADIDIAYYLIHSMGDGGTFHEKERRAASNFGEAAARAGVRRIIYLGGLGHGDDLSPHLSSRHEAGRILAESGVPTIELRASIIIGSGSLSFEMIRALVNRLPIMLTPRWVRVPTQPIAVEDVLAYLVASLEIEIDGSRIFEIGGADVVSYDALMKEYARQRGLRRLMIAVPVLTPSLSSRWLGLVTPLYARIGRKLVDSIRNPTVVVDDSARRAFDIEPRGVAQAVARAIRNEDREIAQTRWSDALSSGGAQRSWGGVQFRGRLVDSRSAKVAVPAAQAFRPIESIGGERGWYYADWLWIVRGFIDLLFGGVGVRRGRRHPHRLRPGDTVDWWRVETVEPPTTLRLAAEMKVPGRAWLQFDVIADEDGSTIRQTAIFDPVGLAGLAYWYAVYPLHALVFRGMLRGVAREAERAQPQPGGPDTRASGAVEPHSTGEKPSSAAMLAADRGSP